MSNDENSNDSENLLPTLITSFGKILPQGGIAALDTTPSLEWGEDAEELFTKLNITTTQSLMTITLMKLTFGDKRVAQELLTLGLRKGLIKKEDLIQLYKMQDEDRRTHSPFLTLEDLWNMPNRAFRWENPKEAKNLPATMFITREDIIELANHFITIHISDVYMFMMQWYRNTKNCPLSKKFFEHWYKETNKIQRIEGKLSSLISIAAYQNYPELVTLDGVLKRFQRMARSDMESHGVHRYCWLCFQVAGENKVDRKKVIEAYIESLLSRIYRASADINFNFYFSIFFGDDGITEEEKIYASSKLYSACLEKSQIYRNLAAQILVRKFT